MLQAFFEHSHFRIATMVTIFNIRTVRHEDVKTNSQIS